MGSRSKIMFRRVLFAATLVGVCGAPSYAQTTPHLKPVTTVPAALVTGIRHWSTSTYTRVAIDLGNQVQFEAARVQNPDRIYFDLHHAHLSPELAGKSFTVTDGGFLTLIRTAQISPELTRIVLDVHDVKQYSAFILPNPYRLIIDIHGIADPHAKPPAPKPAPAPIPAPVTASAAVEVSTLPPMPVTGSELAAVSREPSKVAGTHHPTSQPIVSNATPQPPQETFAAGVHADHAQNPAFNPQPLPAHAATHTPVPTPAPTTTAVPAPAPTVTAETAAHPIAAAPPTADGETSLVRALGLKINRIVIDAGHGGHDSGTLGVGGIREKDVVLDVALRLGKLLHDRLGAEIVYTRSDDTFVPLETRTAIANKAQADLFISVHANSSPEPNVRGVEVYYLNFTSDPDAMRVAARENAVSSQSVHDLSDLVKKIALKDKIDESKELASDVDTSLYSGLTKGNADLHNRGVKKAPFVVLIGANMPSILAEISFVTNQQDATQLGKPEYRERVAESLYAGVARYANAINGHKTHPAPTQRAAR
jgi:N-acetylmuramoyl-L-alanine amidase